MDKKEYFIVNSDGDVLMDFEATEGTLDVIKNIIENTLDNY